MILKTQIRPDRFQRIISGKKKEYRIPVKHIELTENNYEVAIFTTSFSRYVLVAILGIEEDLQTGEYVITLGKLKTVVDPTRQRKQVDSNYQLRIEKDTKKKYIQKCEILRDGQKVGILNLNTKQGVKQRQQLGRLQGYSFNDLPLEIITN